MVSFVPLQISAGRVFRLQSSAGVERVDLHGPRYSTSVRSHDARFAELPADPLGLFGVLLPRAPFAGEVDASRDGARDSANGASGATRSGRAPTDGVGVIADG